MTALNPVMRVGDQIAEAVLAHPETAAAGSARQKPGSRAWKRCAPWPSPTRSPRSRLSPSALRRATAAGHDCHGGGESARRCSLPMSPRPRSTSPSRRKCWSCSPSCAQKFSLAMLFISHDLAVVSQVAHRIGVMYAGSVVEMGTARDVFRNPRAPLYPRTVKRRADLAHRPRPAPADHRRHGACYFRDAAGVRFRAALLAARSSLRRALPPLVEVAPGHFARCPVVAAEVR